MLFTSAVFVFLYLPVVLIGFYALGKFSPNCAIGWLFLSSLVFYGYWMPEFTVLLLGSIGWNFWVGSRIAHVINDESKKVFARRLLITGITVNLLLLAYFKYANFFIDNLALALEAHWQIERIILPIGISFFTFTQIAFLADTYQKKVREYAFIDYGLFVTYFPHLIAGPVLHHAQMMPQFRQPETFKIDIAKFASGLAIFVIGLFKKIILADGISPFADAIFNASEAGAIANFNEAWLGAIAYTLQLYFDFSGYSDMAIGLSWMFNIRLPFNFNSPYQSSSIIDFWRRWHMSLSSFLRDYLYIPLGGNRKGVFRRYLNLFTTMLLGGLWHGANWTFVFWGALHGIYLVINHAFQVITLKYQATSGLSLFLKLSGWMITFLAVVIAWVFFRSTSFTSAVTLLKSMLNIQIVDISDRIHPLLWNQGLHPEFGLLCCILLTVAVAFLPNSNRIGQWLLVSCRQHLGFCQSLIGMSLTFTIFLILINSLRSSVSAFIYFNF